MLRLKEGGRERDIMHVMEGGNEGGEECWLWGEEARDVWCEGCVNEGERDVWEHTRGGIFRSIRMGV